MTWMPAGPAILFVPADRPDRFAKAASAADMVILDLEDGCRPENRAAARIAISECDLDPATTIVRVNPPGTPEFAADMEMVRTTAFRQLMCPKAEGAASMEAFAAELPDAQVIALAETALGVMRAEETAASESCVALFWGAEDLLASMGGVSSRFADGVYRDVPRFARAQVHLAAAAHGKAMLDAVFMDIQDSVGLQSEATDAAALGFAGSVCIHPLQVPVIRAAYAPAAEQVQWAEGLLAAAADNQGAFRYQGRMVDEPLFRQAQSILNRARVSA